VVGFHAGYSSFSGGFVGVDVFFVISGFLITRVLVNELQSSGSIALLPFYARRVRRLIPAFFVVTCVTLILGAFVLVPIQREHEELSRSAYNAALYVSNFYFARKGGYFDGSSETYPLLHTWSLSVEEQFYLVWPPFLLVLIVLSGRLKRNAQQLAILALLAVSIFSLAACWWQTMSDERAARSAFFMLTTRAWELAAGALLAVLGITHLEPRVGTPLALGGVVTIILACASFDAHTPFPGVAALLPVIGTCAVIAGCVANTNGAVARLLSVRPFVWIGLISYSWYLWHWPLLALTRAHYLGERQLARDTVIVLCSLLCAWLTYRWVENPIRTRRVFHHWRSEKIIAAGCLASILILLGVGSLRVYSKSLLDDPAGPYRKLAAAQVDFNVHRATCNQEGYATKFAAMDHCTFGPSDARSSIVLWGDSHADHLMPALEAISAPAKLRVLQRSMSGCAPLLGIIPYRGRYPRHSCGEFNTMVLSEIRALASLGPTGVILSARWSTYLNPSPPPTDGIYSLTYDGSPLPADAAAVALTTQLKHTITTLRQLGVPVLVVAPVPEHRFVPAQCLARRDEAFCSISVGESANMRAPALSALEHGLEQSVSAHLIDPFHEICGADRCPVSQDGNLLYTDANHLSRKGAEMLSPWLETEVRRLFNQGLVTDYKTRTEWTPRGGQ
jgi:peptidoglycan/LPS O-acetylase OafA/YrhL